MGESGRIPSHTARHRRSGDSLLVGDVRRPELLIGDQAIDRLSEAERVETQYDSINSRLFNLPEHLDVYPNHLGGSTYGGST